MQDSFDESLLALASATGAAVYSASELFQLLGHNALHSELAN